MKKTFRLLIATILLASCLAACSAGAEKQQTDASQTQTATAIFNERCKKAGEKIHRTVKEVEGIYLIKVRRATNFDDQFRLDDPYGHDSTNDMYVMNFLRGFHHQKTSTLIPGEPRRKGFRYVEAEDTADGKRYRYTGRMEEPWQSNKSFLQGYVRFVLDRQPAGQPGPRYGVTYEDISTREDREHWIAGSSLKVIDLKTGEVLGERIGYMIDTAQGSRAGGRSPWLLAADNACPGFQANPLRPRSMGGGASAQPGQTLIFVEEVLQPIQ